ncbi:16880_t:CDS:1, partial [Cetraspora pellucida]
QNSLSEDRELQWQITFQDNLYTCESPILNEEHLLYNTFFVHELISYNLPIETNYYACTKKDRIQLCYWSRDMDDLSDLPRD